jgi:hypothetical protein
MLYQPAGIYLFYYCRYWAHIINQTLITCNPRLLGWVELQWFIAVKAACSGLCSSRTQYRNLFSTDIFPFPLCERYVCCIQLRPSCLSVRSTRFYGWLRVLLLLFAIFCSLFYPDVWIRIYLGNGGGSYKHFYSASRFLCSIVLRSSPSEGQCFTGSWNNHLNFTVLWCQ